jgi:hypothetical protein
MWGSTARTSAAGEEMHVHDRTQLLVGGLLDRADLAAAGVVDEHIDAAEVANGLLDDLGVVPRVGDVQGHRAHARAAGGDERAQRPEPPCSRDHRVARCQGGAGDRQAQARRRARDQPHPPTDVHRADPLLAHDDHGAGRRRRDQPPWRQRTVEGRFTVR